MNRLIHVLFLLALVGGCVTTVPLEETPLVGTLDVLGPAVYVNRAHGFQGQRIYSGDQVSTGRHSSAIIRLQGGGFWHLDADTDPWFELVRKGGRWFLRVIQGIGQSLARTGEREVEVKTEHGLFSQFGTRFNLRVVPGETALTVLEGRMELLEPRRMPVTRAMQLRISHRRVESLRTLSPAELEETIRWHKEFLEHAGWCCREGEIQWSDWRGCLRRRGTFSRDRERLEEGCAIGRRGWCCFQGEVERLTPGACNARGGRLYGSAPEAREHCRNPPGWCCHDGNVFHTTRGDCLGMGGLVFAEDDRRGAERTCRRDRDPPGWCCLDGDVFWSTRNRCLEMQGFLFADNNRRRAEQACRVDSPPQPPQLRPRPPKKLQTPQFQGPPQPIQPPEFQKIPQAVPTAPSMIR